MKKIILIAVGALALVGISVGASVFIIGSKQAAAPEGQAAVMAEPPQAMVTHYFDFKPEFIVNFSGKGRGQYLMTEISVATHDEKALEVLENHKPELRNDLLMLFGSQDSNFLTTEEGKIKLRQAALETVQGVVEKHYGQPAVNDVFFTRFVVQ